MNRKKLAAPQKGKNLQIIISLLVGIIAVIAINKIRTNDVIALIENPVEMLARFFSTSSFSSSLKSPTGKKMSFYKFKVNDLTGKPYDLEQNVKGKVVLVVNVASQCGLTGQYAGLQKLYDSYKDKGFIILGFPCNQFGGQEPGSSDEIQTFCTRNYGVSFPIMEKINVNGDNTHPLYVWMKKEKTQLLMESVKWNFEKFLIDQNGNVVDRFAPTTAPESLTGAIEKLLSKL